MGLSRQNPVLRRPTRLSILVITARLLVWVSHSALLTLQAFGPVALMSGPPLLAVLALT